VSWQYDIERAAEIAPAFIAAALFLLIIGVGVVVMVRLRYSRDQTVVTDAERTEAARDLSRAGVVVLAIGLAGCAGVVLWVQSFGPTLLVLPAVLVVDGLLFLLFGARIDRR
jgi:archaellum biogenesis protein FlaJ (TadC family)